MFSHRTAWFSPSVSNDVIDLWMQHGGIRDTQVKRDTEFLFSTDPEEQETEAAILGLHLGEMRTVFRADYVSVCHSTSHMEDLSQYVLDVPIHLEIRKAPEEEAEERGDENEDESLEEDTTQGRGVAHVEGHLSYSHHSSPGKFWRSVPVFSHGKRDLRSCLFG